MAAKIIDGKKVAAELRAELKEKVLDLRSKGIIPGLAVVLVGEDPASRSYVTAKEKACAEIGIYSNDNRLPENTTKEELLALITKLNSDPSIHGILVQLPLPKHIDENEVLLAISPDKDVDGFHPMNVGRLVIGQDAFLPCTPHGVIQMLIRNGVKLDGANVVVVGRSNIVGKPVANLLVQKAITGNATVTVCHTHTKNLEKFTRQAEIVIAAAGRPNTITADMITEGTVVIDVGVNRIAADTPKGYKLVGDVDYENVKAKASMITPVPGGVGPMTITMLLFNTVQAASKLLK